MNYEDRAAVKAVIEDLGLFPAWEMGKLSPDLMPDEVTALLATLIYVGFDAAYEFILKFREELDLSSEADHVKDMDE